MFLKTSASLAKRAFDKGIFFEVKNGHVWNNFNIVNDFNLIINSSFVNNTAIMKGGSIFISNQNLKILLSEFSNSYANKGGA